MTVSRPPSPSGHRSVGQTNWGKNEDPVNIYALPPEDRTHELVARYFGDTGLLFPYIHEGSFWETYNEMRSSNFRRVRRSWLGLLNVVMALATNTTIDTESSAEKRAQESDVYYRRAMGLCEKQVMRGTSLEIGQLYQALHRLRWTYYYSAIPSRHGPIPSRYSEICRDMDNPWPCCQSCFATWIAFS